MCDIDWSMKGVHVYELFGTRIAGWNLQSGSQKAHCLLSFLFKFFIARICGLCVPWWTWPTGDCQSGIAATTLQWGSALGGHWSITLWIFRKAGSLAQEIHQDCCCVSAIFWSFLHNGITFNTVIMSLMMMVLLLLPDMRLLRFSKCSKLQALFICVAWMIQVNNRQSLIAQLWLPSGLFLTYKYTYGCSG